MQIRLIFTFVVSLILSPAGPAQASVVQSTQRAHPGYVITITDQVGCATTGDFPSAETEAAVAKDQAARLAELQAIFAAAYALAALSFLALSRIEIPPKEAELAGSAVPDSPIAGSGTTG